MDSTSKTMYVGHHVQPIIIRIPGTTLAVLALCHVGTAMDHLTHHALHAEDPFSSSTMSQVSTMYIVGSYCLNACPTIGYVTSSTNCLACDSTCATCNGISASNCVTCASGYYLSSSTCRLVCPGGTYPNSTTQQCQSCDGSCTYCFGSTINNCSQCITGMVLYNFTCQGSCPNGLTVNQWNVCYADNLMSIIGALLVLSMILMQ